jgi:hypothetical protein
MAAIVCGGKSLSSPSSCFGSSTVLGPPFEEKWPPLSLVAKVYAPRLHLVLDNIAQVQDTEQISPPNPPEAKHQTELIMIGKQ